MVGSVSPDCTHRICVRQSVQAVDRRCVSGQVWGSPRLSGSRRAAADDPLAGSLGKTSRVQMGGVRYDRQHTELEQSDFVRLQALCPQDPVLVCADALLEEEAISAQQR